MTLGEKSSGVETYIENVNLKALYEGTYWEMFTVFMAFSAFFMKFMILLGKWRENEVLYKEIKRLKEENRYLYTSFVFRRLKRSDKGVGEIEKRLREEIERNLELGMR